MLAIAIFPFLLISIILNIYLYGAMLSIYNSKTKYISAADARRRKKKKKKTS